MVPYLLDGDAVRGVVASVNEHRVVVRVRSVRRALMTLDTDDPAVLPAHKKLWWTVTADDSPWEVQAVQPHGHGSRITLMLGAAPTHARLPGTGDRLTLSVLHTRPDAYRLLPPQQAPWTHRPATPPPPPQPIDTGDAEPPPAAVDGTTLPDPGRYT